MQKSKRFQLHIPKPRKPPQKTKNPILQKKQKIYHQFNTNPKTQITYYFPQPIKPTIITKSQKPRSHLRKPNSPNNPPTIISPKIKIPTYTHTYIKKKKKKKEKRKKQNLIIITGMYLNLRRGGSSGAPATSLLSPLTLLLLLLLLLLFWL